VALSSPVTVSNEAYEQAWSDAHNRRIIASVSRPYRDRLPPEEITFRGQIALFKCMKKHEECRGNKFSTSLHRYVSWELEKGLRDYARETNRHPPLPSVEDFMLVAPNNGLSVEVRDCLMKMSNEYRLVLEQTYMEGMSLREIEVKNGYSRQTAYRILNQAREIFKEIWHNTKSLPTFPISQREAE
jgi:hypothetical protein